MKRSTTSPLALSAMIFLLAACASANTHTVTNTNVSGLGSLAQAIADSNADQSPPRLIEFNITTGSPPYVIAPTDPLPAITQTVTIDGYAQPGSSPNTETLTDNAVINVVVDGRLSLEGIRASSSVVRGLQLWRGISVTANGCLIAGCFVGTDGTNPAPHATGIGIFSVYSSSGPLGGFANGVGGPNPADRNVISGNAGSGVYIGGRYADGNLIEGNFIGIAVDGKTAVPNDVGVSAQTYSDGIRGNVISGNRDCNVAVYAFCSVENNYIGTNASGTSAVSVSASGPVCARCGVDLWGYRTSVTGNVISGNEIGLSLYNTSSTNVFWQANTIFGNEIGTDASGDGSIPNTQAAIVVLGGPNDIGGNIVAHNGGSGITVTGWNNRIGRNSIFDNAGLGIALIDNANQGVKPPVLSSAISTPAGTTITGTLAEPGSWAFPGGASFYVEFFANPVSEAGGKTYIGTQYITGTSGPNPASLAAFFRGVLVPTGQFVTGTTVFYGDTVGTSEFSNRRQVNAWADLSIKQTVSPSPAQAGSDVTYLLKVTNKGPDTANGVVVTDFLPSRLTLVGCGVSKGTCSCAANQATATIGTLKPAASATVVIAAAVDPSLRAASRIYNTASVTSTATVLNPADDASTSTLRVANPDSDHLSVRANLISGNPCPGPGSTQSYVFGITLKAKCTVFGVTLTGTVPGLQGNSLVSAGSARMGGATGSPSITWNVPYLAAGQSATLTATAAARIPSAAQPGSLFVVTKPWMGGYYCLASRTATTPTGPIEVAIRGLN